MHTNNLHVLKVANEYDVPFHTLYEKLRQWGLVYKDEFGRNTPTAKALRANWLIVKPSNVRMGNEITRVYTVMVTPRGLEHIGNKLFKESQIHLHTCPYYCVQVECDGQCHECMDNELIEIGKQFISFNPDKIKLGGEPL